MTSMRKLNRRVLRWARYDAKTRGKRIGWAIVSQAGHIRAIDARQREHDRRVRLTCPCWDCREEQGGRWGHWTCPSHGSTSVDEDGVMRWSVETTADGIARCLRVGCNRTSAGCAEVGASR